MPASRHLVHAARAASDTCPPRLVPPPARDAFHRQDLRDSPRTREGARRLAPASTIPWLCRFGSPFDMASRVALDPPGNRLFTGADAPHAAYRLLQVKRSSNTPSSPARPRPRGEQAHRPSGTRSEERIPTGLTQPRGCSLLERPTTSDGDRSPGGFDPDLVDPDTSCRGDGLDEGWKSSPSRRCGNDAAPPVAGTEAANTAWLLTLSRDWPLGPPGAHPRERIALQAAPEVPSAAQLALPTVVWRCDGPPPPDGSGRAACGRVCCNAAR